MTDCTKYFTNKLGRGTLELTSHYKSPATRLLWITGQRKCVCGYEEHKKKRASRRRRSAARRRTGKGD